MQASLRAAQVRSQLDGVVVDNPRARQAHKVFDFLIAHGEHQGAQAKRCVLLVGPSQSGKSTILRPYVERRNTPEQLEAGKIPVLFVDLKPAIITKGLAQNTLDALGRQRVHRRFDERQRERAAVPRGPAADPGRVPPHPEHREPQDRLAGGRDHQAVPDRGLILSPGIADAAPQVRSPTDADSAASQPCNPANLSLVTSLSRAD